MVVYYSLGLNCGITQCMCITCMYFYHMWYPIIIGRFENRTGNIGFAIQELHIHMYL